ncbi:MAG: DNA-binding protein [Firmicutes bacterium]|nr:DNA-binding protein [Bacillota bacterium]
MLDRTEAAILLDFYGQLLTDRQREAMAAYYEEDLSLGEIAENLGISRPGVHDLLQRSANQLRSLEERLGLAGKDRKRRKRIAQIREDLQELAGLSGLPKDASRLIESIKTKLTELESI